MSVNLSTQYLGLKLKNPLVVSACPWTEKVDIVKRLEAAGAAAVVMPSLFEEQIAHEESEINRLHETGADSFAEAHNYFPDLGDYRTGPESYLDRIGELKNAVSIPVFASLNGVTTGGWVDHARRIQEAGADGLELNIYYIPTDPGITGPEVEDQYVDLVAAVRQAITIPLAVKIGPFFSSMPNMAQRLVDAGANGLVLFNRFLQPDIDLDALTVRAELELSTERELRLPLRWIAILHQRIKASLAATRGVTSADDALKLLLAGADVAMVCSVLLKRGPEHLSTILQGVREWLEEKEYESVDQMKGSMDQMNCPDPSAFERANYMKALLSYSADLA